MPITPVGPSGLRADQLEKGKCYDTTSVMFSTGGVVCIKIESIGPTWVRYRGWTHDYGDWRNPYYWTKVKRHPRVLFDSWDGTWFEVEDPS